MILFVCGQYGSAQYLHPFIQCWKQSSEVAFEIISVGISEKLWCEHDYSFIRLDSADREEITKILKVRKPELIVTSLSANIEAEFLFIQIAADLCIKTAGFIDTWTNYKNRFRCNNADVYPDFILAIDERCKQELTREGVPANRIIITGQPYLESIAREKPSLGNEILIVSQPVRKYRGKSLGYDEGDFFTECLKISTTDRVVYCRHPDEEETLRSETVSNFNFTYTCDLKNLESAHTIIGMFSSLMVIGFLWDRKVISLQPDLKVNDPCPLSRWGDIPLVNNGDELQHILNEPLTETRKNEEFSFVFNDSVKRLYNFCQSQIALL